MKQRNILGIIGALLVIVGGFSPMVHIPVVGNWNYWDLHTGMAVAVYVLAGLGLLAAAFNKSGLLKFSGVAILVLVLLTLVAVHFKVNDSFSFIPLKKLAKAAAGIVKYRWIGWSLLAVGSVLMFFSAKKARALTQ